MNSSPEIMEKWRNTRVKYSFSVELSNFILCGDKKEAEENEEEGSKKAKPGVPVVDPGLTFLLVWNEYVFKISEKDPKIALDFFMSPIECNFKLKYSPIMLKVYSQSNSIGIVQINFSDCFCNSVLFEEFFAQMIDEDLNFMQEEVQAAKCLIKFSIQKDVVQQINLNELDNKNETEELNEDDVAKSSSETSDKMFCESFKISRDLPLNCKNFLETFHKLNF